MIARATTTVSIVRGQAAADYYGDVEPTDTVYRSGIPASLIEKMRHVLTPESPTPMIVRYATCRLPAGTPIQDLDRIKDETTGITYEMMDFVQPASPVHAQDVNITLKRIT